MRPDQRKHRVAVVGLWHLGLVTSVCLAEAGNRVIGVDLNKDRVSSLLRGTPTIFEPGLETLMKSNMSSERLSFTLDPGVALKGARYLIFAVDVQLKEDDEPDLTEIFEAVKRTAPFIENGCTVVITSQVPIGTCEKIESIIYARKPALTMNVAYIPENLRLGEAIQRFNQPDMLVVGVNALDARLAVERLYSFISAPRVLVNIRTAEMVKHAINAYLAAQVSFINEIGNLSELLGVDGVKVGEAMKLDRRIGLNALLRPGLGFGGGTLGRDLKVLLRLGKVVGYRTELIKQILSVNRRQNEKVVEKLASHFGRLKRLKIGVLGLTYKPGTSTLRRSVSLDVIHSLARRGAKVTAHDPMADLTEIHGAIDFRVADTALRAAEGADALIIMTPWPEYKELDYERVKKVMRRPVLIDPQNSLDQEKMAELGFSHLGIGRAITADGGGPRKR